MYHVEVKNCNSILTGNIKVEEGKLSMELMGLEKRQ